MIIRELHQNYIYSIMNLKKKTWLEVNWTTEVDARPITHNGWRSFSAYLNWTYFWWPLILTQANCNVQKSNESVIKRNLFDYKFLNLFCHANCLVLIHFCVLQKCFANQPHLNNCHCFIFEFYIIEFKKIFFIVFVYKTLNRQQCYNDK